MIDIFSNESNIIEALLKFRILNSYIMNMRNRDIYTFEKKINDYYLFLSNNNIENIELNVNNIDVDLKNIDLYKNIV